MEKYNIITMYDVLATQTTFGDFWVAIRQSNECIVTIIQNVMILRGVK